MGGRLSHRTTGSGFDERTDTSGKVTDPSGCVQSLRVGNPLTLRLGQETTGSFSSPPKWSEPWCCDWPGTGRPMHLAEEAEVGSWLVYRVIWHVGGLSGPPPMPFVLVAQHRESKAWTACANAVNYPPTPDRANLMRADLDNQGRLIVRWWNWESRNTSALHGWRFDFQNGAVSMTPVAPVFALNTRNGAVASFSSTNSEARHLGFQEVGWFLAAWDSMGGTARAFAESPRRLVTKEDKHGAPILPKPGDQTFEWAGEIYLVPRSGDPRKVPLKEALQLLQKRKWTVVLFHRRGQSPLAMRLAEHHRDFPHCTPPPPPRGT